MTGNSHDHTQLYDPYHSDLYVPGLVMHRRSNIINTKHVSRENGQRRRRTSIHTCAYIHEQMCVYVSKHSSVQ